jgi:hypothetical protein
MNDGDKKWIEDAIRHHDRRFPTGPDSIAMSVVTANQEQRELELTRTVSTTTGVINNNEMGRRMTVALPENLYIVLIKRYPQLFKQDIKWFKRNFPMFVLEKGDRWR